MKKSDIGLLFDVSGSMQSPFNLISNNNYNYNTRADELTNIIEKICNRGNRLKNEQIRIFSILFGGRKELIYDFCNLIDIANQKFRYTLTSNPYSKASPNGFAKRLKNILSDHGNKTLYLDNYLYCDSGPTERLCEMGCYLIEGDKYLQKEIYNSLPNECKSLVRDIGVSGLNFFGLVKESVQRGTSDVINDIYKKCINAYVSRIISEEISQRKNNGNNLRFIDGNDLVNIKRNLEGKLTTPDKKDFNILDLFSEYIYGNTPLYTAINLAFDNLKKQSNNEYKKFIFIISDGELNDVNNNVDYINEITKKAKENNVIIISIFLTSQSIPKAEKLYDTCQSHFTKGSKDLFLMSSSLNYENPVIKFLIQKGWDIPTSGECKLFVEINNSQNLNNFIDIINEAIGELNNKNNIEITKNPNSLINLLTSTTVNDYVNSQVINKYEAKSQKGGTCYANAIAAGICLASSRVLGRPKLDFFELREKLVNKYGTEGANTNKVLNEMLGNYRLHFKRVNEEEARKAIMKTRPCIAVFHMDATKWGNFTIFFKNNPKGILTKEIINENKYYEWSTPGGHAVVLTHISKDYLKFLNSWGKDWGDNGYFRVKDADVLGAYFFDIFWYVSDLNNEEINYYNNYMENLKKDINDYVFN